LLIVKNKVRKFQDGGVSDENFTPEQLKFLGGADRTDPYILARMRRAAPDAPKTAKLDTKVDTGEIRDEFGEKSSIRKNTETGELYDTAPSISKEIKKTPVKNTPKPIQSKKTDINEMPEKLRAPDYKVSNSVRLPNKPNIKANLDRKMAERKKVSNTMDSAMDYSNTESTFKSGGKVSSASKRADGCAVRGKTRA
jgi:hypothetical protein